MDNQHFVIGKSFFFFLMVIVNSYVSLPEGRICPYSQLRRLRPLVSPLDHGDNHNPGRDCD